MRVWTMAALGGVFVAALAAAQAAGQDAVLLRHTLKTGDKAVYGFTMRSSQTIDMGGAMGGMQQMPVDFGATMKMAFDVKEFDEESGKAAVRFHMTEVKLDMSGMPGAEMMGGSQMPEEFEMNGTIDTRNRVTGLRMPGPGAGGAGAMMSGMNMMGPLFVEFPEKPVRFGESWKVTIPKNPMMGDKDVLLDATLAGEREFNGVPAYVIKVRGTIPLKGDLGEMLKDDPNVGAMLGGMKMLMSGSIEMNGESLVEKGTGRILKMDVLSRSDQVMEMPDMGLRMTMTGNTTIAMAIR